MTEPPPEPSTVLFSEPGATWWWLLIGPVSAGTMLFMQLNSGYGWQPLLPLVFLVLVTGFLGLQVKAARMHTSVELTSEYLRQGAETILVSEIVRIYPEFKGGEVPTWKESHALGELTGVPRRRTGIGVKLRGDRRAQAWARRHRRLRAALGSLVNEHA